MNVLFGGGTKVSVEAIPGMMVHTDQPVASGGTGTAPSPFDVFLASLAGCAGYFLQQFLNSREISTEGISLSLSRSWNEETHLLKEIVMHLQLPAGFPEKYIKPAVRSMEQCTVKRHLRDDIDIRVDVKQG